MENECLFCELNRFNINKELLLPERKYIIWEDENVYASPDLFPLVVGHFLVVSKYHYNSFANAPCEVYTSVKKALRFIKSNLLNDANTATFEHGAVIEHSGGSSIDHAHIHIMPFNKDLKSAIEESPYIMENPFIGSEIGLSIMAKKQYPYILYQKNSEAALVYHVNKLPSQFLRIIISKELNTEFDWHKMRIDGTAKQKFIETLALANR